MSKSIDSKVKISIVWLIIVGILGVMMRMAFVIEWPVWLEYRNILHTHSHLAIMGWLFSIIYLLIVKTFHLEGRFYNQIFWWIQVTNLGMFIFFPIQGYGSGSIPFTTLHMILSYVFAYRAYKDVSRSVVSGSQYSAKFLKTSLIFMVISTLGTWALAYMMASNLKGSPVYYASIQFFLHFQFNGWFIFALIGILLKFMENHGILNKKKHLNAAYWTLLVSCIFTYALSITWSTPEDIIFYLNSTGVIIQFIALILFYKWYTLIRSEWTNVLGRFSIKLLKFSLMCLAFKIFIQTLVAIPALAVISYTIKNFIIGFIHLLMLGGITTFGLVFIAKEYQINTGLLKPGVSLFILGFIVTELLLFGQGIMLWQQMGFFPYYYILITIASALMPIGFILLYIKLKRI